jgi:hypothetical protein
MSVLGRQKERAAVIVEGTKIPLSKRDADKTRGRPIPPGMQKIPSLLRVHEMKVLAVRQQLAEGKFDLDERLDAVVESLLAAVTTLE